MAMVGVSRLVLVASILGLRGADGYSCVSDVVFKDPQSSHRKGLALDGSTFEHCSSRIPSAWPNSGASVSSLRLIKAWSKDWIASGRTTAWENLAAFVTSNKVDILLGTQITCDSEKDDEDWAWTKELIQMLPLQQIMGVAIGNELDILQDKESIDSSVTAGCIQRLWGMEGFWKTFQSRVAELDALGYGSVPITTVLTGAALGGSPFKEEPGATVNSFLTAASKKYGHRFAFTFNFYPYFDPNYQLDPDSDDACTQALESAACFGDACQVPSSVKLARGKIQQVSGDSKSLFWVGETGWSTPHAESLHTAMLNCSAWSSKDVFRRYYEQFLDWDLEGAGASAPDHIFYFDIRDSFQYGVQGSFGLIESCSASVCKIRSANFTAPSLLDLDALSTPAWPWYPWLWTALGCTVLCTCVSTWVAMMVKISRKRCCTPPRLGHDQDSAGSMA